MTAAAGGHRYRYRLTSSQVLDDVHGLGPERLRAAAAAVLRVLPARTVGGRVEVELDELERLDDDRGGSS